MENLLAYILFAHILADYFFQPKSMAIKKSAKSLGGASWCFLHSLIYTACFALVFFRFDPLFVFLIFTSHYPIDRWSLGQKWLSLIGGRDPLKAYGSNDKYRELDIAFSAIVYTITDNSLHLFLVWIILHILS